MTNYVWIILAIATCTCLLVEAVESREPVYRNIYLFGVGFVSYCIIRLIIQMIDW